MTKTEEAKIKIFLQDQEMSEAVKKVITETFLEEDGAKDVNTLAAERIALNLLNKAYKKLETYKQVEKQKLSDEINIGL